jgi:hypothetical protein
MANGIGIKRYISLENYLKSLEIQASVRSIIIPADKLVERIKNCSVLLIFFRDRSSFPSAWRRSTLAKIYLTLSFSRLLLKSLFRLQSSLSAMIRYLYPYRTKPPIFLRQLIDYQLAVLGIDD